MGRDYHSFFLCMDFVPYLLQALCTSAEVTTSAKYKSVRNQHAFLSDPLIACASAGIYFQMLPCPPGPVQSAVILWKSIRDATSLTIRIVKVRSCWDVCAGLQDTLRAAETSAQVCGRFREQPRPLCKLNGRVAAIFSQLSFLGFHNHKSFPLSYLSLLPSQDSQHHNTACII